MLNEIHVEGVVTGRRWRYSDAEFVRLAVYPDAGRSTRRAEGDGRELPDYITLRCEGQHALAAGNLREGDRIRAAGMLTSRDYEIPLETFAGKARGAPEALESVRAQARAHGGAVTMPHTINEVLVERLAIVERGERRPRTDEAARRVRESSAGPAVEPLALSPADACGA